MFIIESKYWSPLLYPQACSLFLVLIIECECGTMCIKAQYHKGFPILIMEGETWTKINPN